MEYSAVEAQRSIARRAIIGVKVFLAVEVAAGLASFAMAASDAPGGAASDLALLDAGIALLDFLVFVVSGILVLRWIHRTNRIAHGFGEDAVAMSPGWNVGWFFVPIASLWKPFEGVRESYQASVNPEAPYHVEVPQAMRLWWGFWIAWNILTNLAFRFQMLAGADGGGRAASNFLYGIAGFVGIPLCLALIATIREVTGVQCASASAATFA